MKILEGNFGVLVVKSVAIATAAFFASQAQAARAYHFTGKVTGIRPDTIALSRGLETLEFNRTVGSPAASDLNEAKIGDELTIWYKLEPVKVESALAPPPQEPGQVAPESQPDKAPPSEKKQIIIDDRAFYDARNDLPARNADFPGA